MSFESSGLSSALVRATRERGYLEPTAIQAQAIPAVLKGLDVLGSAQTGSGKTAAFALPILQRLLDLPRDRPRQVRALLLVPTRELAAQVGDTLRHFAQYLPEPLKIAVLFGGVSINPQMMGLRGGADIVVATPGRLLDLLDHNALRIDEVGVLVLDEADRLLDLGFAEELNRILGQLPARRQNLFFSATFPPVVQGLADQLLRDPVRIEVPLAPETQPDILQRAIEVDTAKRTPLLRHLIKEHGWTRVLVFVATKYATELVTHKLGLAGIHAHAFHGELSQGARTQVLADFKASRVQVVVATDVAARGIDVARLPAVVNYDLPRSPVDYVHRIGRTGRAGQSGVAVSFITADAEAHFRLIEKRQGVRVPREQVPGFERVEVAAPVLDAHGGVKGQRPSKKDKLRAAAARSRGG
ncbi:DEAD/DEAH box helicase [Aquabacterium sp.]|uniref:DEAD/DEAH box helicase n=1 Tax=Aquabacterium sp. TaxID=1872578 RepID=UPI003D6CCB3E